MSETIETARRVLKEAEEREQKPKPLMVRTEDGLVSQVSARMLDRKWGECNYMVGRKDSHEREGYARYFCLVCQAEKAAPQLKPLEDCSIWTHICPGCGRRYTILESVQEPADLLYVPERR